jgi:hypothetical protein
MSTADTRSRKPGVLQAFTDNARAWRLSRPWSAVLLIAPLVPVPAAVVLAVSQDPLFFAATVEDGSVEWLQVLVLLAASAAYLMLAQRVWHRGARAMALLFVAVGIGAIIVAGEEISWAQRLLGWSTPEELDAINRQGELNLHNIKPVEFATRIGQLGASAYGTLVPLLVFVPLVAGRINGSYLVPPLAMISFFAIPLGYWLVRIPVEPARPMLRFSEVPELALYMGLAVFGWLTLRREAREPRATRTVRSSA